MLSFPANSALFELTIPFYLLNFRRQSNFFALWRITNFVGASLITHDGADFDDVSFEIGGNGYVKAERRVAFINIYRIFGKREFAVFSARDN
jgi:hypothetical protein